MIDVDVVEIFDKLRHLTAWRKYVSIKLLFFPRAELMPIHVNPGSTCPISTCDAISILFIYSQ